MTMQEPSGTGRVKIGEYFYLTAPVPVHFPDREVVPESKRHLEVRTALYQFLKLAFADRAAVGSEQFVYWDPTDPRQCLAPDVFVRFGAPDEMFGIWKLWQRGAPHVAIEVVAPSGGPRDESDRNWDAKLDRYRRMGVAELVRFDPEVDGGLLRIWDSVDDDLVERQVTGRVAQSKQLPGFWVVTQDPELGPMLRLSHDELGQRLYPTPVEREAEARQREVEARQREAEGRQREAEGRQREAEGRQREHEARLAAERRVRELEAELRRQRK
jgi:hypothetical protein